MEQRRHIYATSQVAKIQQLIVAISGLTKSETFFFNRNFLASIPHSNHLLYTSHMTHHTSPQKLPCLYFSFVFLQIFFFKYVEGTSTGKNRMLYGGNKRTEKIYSPGTTYMMFSTGGQAISHFTICK